MTALLHQIFSGLAMGGIYAILALALVMIYQATQLVNFAQGEMAMFSTYIAWELVDSGMPYWAAFALTIVAFLHRRHGDRAARDPPFRQCAGSDHRHRLHRPAADLQQRRRLALQLYDQDLRQPVSRPAVVRQYLHVVA